MKVCVLVAPILFILFLSCGEQPSADTPQSTDTTQIISSKTIYQTITDQICHCTTVSMRNNKPSATLDSCYKEAIDKNKDSLKRLGINLTTLNGYKALLNEIRLEDCDVLDSLMQEQAKEAKAKRSMLSFTGQLISQTKVEVGYELILRNDRTKEQKVFISHAPLNENSMRNLRPGFEVDVEYMIVRNP